MCDMSTSVAVPNNTSPLGSSSGALLFGPTYRFTVLLQSFSTVALGNLGRDAGALNGKPYKLIGTNLHQFMPWVGNAVTNRYHRRRVDDIKSIGCNWIRLSHYPHDPDLLDHCDRIGLLCLAEGPTWMYEGNATWWNNLEKSFRRMIRRDRNHPAIFMWNACINHSSCNNRLNTAAHEEDATRPTGSGIYAAHRGRAIFSP
ncbi:MAG: hypothetical protein GF398_14580 [Chitinivibrionales bacterium]|nr:hypothetical protein [Chitinivibrionales bacterium]